MASMVLRRRVGGLLARSARGAAAAGRALSSRDGDPYGGAYGSPSRDGDPYAPRPASSRDGDLYAPRLASSRDGDPYASRDRDPYASRAREPYGSRDDDRASRAGDPYPTRDDAFAPRASGQRAASDSSIEGVEYDNELEVGSRHKARVVRIVDFGAFVELLGDGKQGAPAASRIRSLVHISELQDGYVEKVEDVVELDEVVDVEVISNENLKIALSMRRTSLPVLKPTALVLFNAPFIWDDKDVEDIMEDYGKVLHVDRKMKSKNDLGQERVVTFVVFENPDAAATAMRGLAQQKFPFEDESGAKLYSKRVGVAPAEKYTQEYYSKLEKDQRAKDEWAVELLEDENIFKRLYREMDEDGFRPQLVMTPEEKRIHNYLGFNSPTWADDPWP
ncbi:hypothetical protein M885DRAFT_612117 [Pelagophyceae sp. CCMP2097]|nr:hypothetical protein M885DRAFT_612117 [Pelagophyceae sp. CCMP2097]